MFDNVRFTSLLRFGPHILAVFLSSVASSGAAQNADTGALPPQPLTQSERPQVNINAPELVINEPPDTDGFGVQARDVLGQRSDNLLIIEVPEFTIVGRDPLEDVVIHVPDFVIIAQDEDQEEAKPQETSRLTDIGIVPLARDPSASDQPPQQEATLGYYPMCHGDYAAFFGRGQGTAVGFAMPVGKNLEVKARVEALDCGRSLSVTIRGQNILMSGDLQSRTYSGSFNMGDGAARTLVLMCDQDLGLRGYLTASDQNLAIKRPVWMIGNGVAQFDLTACPAQD
ncbi:hypothetical protein [Pelagimonas varians]|uniref:Uncharacterized protein n=1 Tax=Pelagimonas varians TaxID=696760 RepID=A0A238KW76_9RHOB|nr:hypothetical protein [Pelagimonas varians]PYG28012.1 hypothetical protein C8N36_11344 [Pelagimonas varians]SMX47055.1 hypothetical protein PEV8663_03458 [Pelagimonas varians]